MKPLVTPVVNLNGSPKGRLVDQLTAVTGPLRATIRAMREATPHGRDFQHLIRGADWGEHRRVLDEAQQAWGERLVMLCKLLDEIEAHAYEIAKQ